jgi:dTDP-glucose pyrophosphorylase
VNIIPLAGRGSRFSAVGYRDPKPLIPVSGKPMILQASEALPPAQEHVFVALGEHVRQYPLIPAITGCYPDADIKVLDAVTEGQACTVELGIENVAPDAPLLVGACDNAMLYDQPGYEALRRENDVIVFTFRHHVSVRRNPQMYGYVRLDEQGRVSGVSVKKPISDTPSADHAIVGAFYFARTAFFREAYASLVAKNERVNNEFYVDSLVGELVRASRKVAVFEVTDYVCFGTPDDLHTFEYWQSFFHKCPWHPYDVARDPTVTPQAVPQLVKQFVSAGQPYE